MFDRWTQHTSHCQHCQATLCSVETWRRHMRVALGCCVLWIAHAWQARVGAVLCLALLELSRIVEAEFKEGGHEHWMADSVRPAQPHR